MKFEAGGREFAKTLRSLEFRTICSNSERSEQVLVTECFLTCSWWFLILKKLEKLEFKLGKKMGFRNMPEKLENRVVISKKQKVCET